MRRTTGQHEVLTIGAGLLDSRTIGSELANSDKVNCTDKKERVNLGLEFAKRA